MEISDDDFAVCEISRLTFVCPENEDILETVADLDEDEDDVDYSKLIIMELP